MRFNWVRGALTELGALSLFTARTFRAIKENGVRLNPVVDQIYRIGVESVATTVIAGGFIGAILAIQLNMQLKDFGAQALLGGLSTSTTVRDLGPVLIAFILSGKVGAFTSAELATMKVTEQIDAISCLGSDPFSYLVVPRMIAIVLSSFFLLIVGLMMTVLGGMLLSELSLGVNSLSYMSKIGEIVTGQSIVIGIFKSLVFGFLIAIISCFYGYNAKGGAQGVGHAVRLTSVRTLLAIIFSNYSISAFVKAIQELMGATV